MRRLFLSIAVLCSVLLTCCGGGKKDTQTSKTEIMSDPEYEAELDLMMDGRARARSAAVEAFRQAFPSEAVLGSSSIEYAQNTFVVSIDYNAGGARRTTEYVVRLFVDSGGKAYLKTDALTIERAAMLHGKMPLNANVE